MKILDESLKKELISEIDELFNSVSFPDRFLELKEFFNAKWGKVQFVHTKFEDFKHLKGLILVFENYDSFYRFVEHEQNLALESQNFVVAASLRDVLIRKNNSDSIGFFYLYYGFQPYDDYLKILYNTNSLSFRYGVVKV